MFSIRVPTPVYFLLLLVGLVVGVAKVTKLGASGKLDAMSLDQKINQEVANYNNTAPKVVQGKFGKLNLEKMEYKDKTLSIGGEYVERVVMTDDDKAELLAHMTNHYCKGDFAWLAKNQVSVIYTIKFVSHSLDTITPPHIVSLDPSNCNGR